MTTTTPCKCCSKDALVLGHKGLGQSVVRCPHCTYVCTIPTEPNHPKLEQVERIPLLRGKGANKLLALALFDLGAAR